MDCLKAQDILSEAIDRTVDSASLTDARAHCAGCTDCAAFERALDLMSRAGLPIAPQPLVDRIVTLGNIEAVLLRATAAETGTAPAAVPVVRLSRFRRPQRLAAFASIAAVLLVALVAIGITLGGLDRSKRALTDTAGTSWNTEPLGAPDAATTSTEAYRDSASQSAAPPYVVLDGLVYAPVEVRTAQPSSFVTATPIVTALDTGTDPTPVPTFRIAGRNDAIVLESPPGTYLEFEAVSREFGRRRFMLTSDVDIAAYGAWPLPPRRFPVPTSSDGSPTFSFFAKDDSGVLIYVPRGGQPRNGFAVAPGTAVDDPAAGNPNWTWWQPE